MAKLTNFKAQQVEFPTHYELTDTGRGNNIKNIVPAYGTVREQGTPETSEIYNGLQLGNVHTLQATKTTLLNIDYYECSLDGLNEFGLNTDLKIRLTVDAQNTNTGAKLRLNGVDYTILKENNGQLGRIEVGDFKANKTYELTYNGNQFIIINLINTATETEAGLVSLAKIKETIRGNAPSNERVEALESSLEKLIGMPYGGNIQDAGTKTTGKFYYDNTTKYYYECIADTNLTYNESSKFRVISNRPLSDKVGTLSTVETYSIDPRLTVGIIHKIGDTCILTVDSSTAYNGKNYGDVLFNIPEKFRPKYLTSVSVGILNSTNGGAVQIERNGNVVWRGAGRIPSAIYINAVYLTK